MSDVAFHQIQVGRAHLKKSLPELVDQRLRLVDAVESPVNGPG